MTRCPSGKICYADWDQAVYYCTGLRRQEEAVTGQISRLMAYHCDRCPYCHIGHTHKVPTKMRRKRTGESREEAIARNEMRQQWFREQRSALRTWENEGGSWK